ncbi:hypothetical protein F4778DRAFT_223395 [Xylariomycetidae sp. FL2044]|nr:hypothetical protein F4778DRAFT_223395 [Xylariomycetidae sp. FL2044]
MSLPEPPVSLTGGCSVLFDNTLYAYTSAGFQSLALEEGAEWVELPSGESVEGGVCVGSTPKESSTAGLFVVGGTSGSSDYTGLQKFTYSTGEWETITPQSLVTKDRVYHSAIYVSGADSILVYSGTTDGNPNLSQQTFTISTSEPYGVLAYQSTVSTPGVAPILLQWSETQAVMVGGTETNTKVMLFDTTNVWTDSGIILAQPLPKNTTEVKAAIITADDGSKHLYTFDLSTSPNTVNRTVLVDANGTPMVNATPVPKADLAERDLTIDNWPQYNSSLAPSTTRSGWSLATNSEGLMVMSGGSEGDPLCVFDGKDNSWKNTTAIFASEGRFQIQSTPTSATASSGSPTATSATSATGMAETSPATTTAVTSSSSSDDDGMPGTTLLGIVLGTVFGVAIILLIILFMFKRAKNKQRHAEAGHARRASGFPEEKVYLPDDDLAQASGGYFRGHVPQDSAGSFSSMAMLMGKTPKPTIQRKPSNDSKRSSVSSIMNKQFKSTIGRPQPQQPPVPEFLAQEDVGNAYTANIATSNAQPRPRAGPPVNREGSLRRSSGWNRYWSGGSSLNILGFGNNGHSSKRETAASEQSSFYSDKHRMTQDSATVPNRMTQDSATVPPLHVDGRPEFSRVKSGSPTVSQYNPRVREAASAQIERPVSAVSAVSALSSSGYSSGIPPSIHDTWDPDVMKKAWGSERAPSSAYSQSNYPTALGAPGTGRPPTNASRQPQFTTAPSSDMSWLNLGDNNNHNSRPYH